MAGKKQRIFQVFFLSIMLFGGVVSVIGFVMLSHVQPHSWGKKPQAPKQKFEELPLLSPILTSTPTPTPKPLVPDLLPGEHGIKVPILLYHYISINPNKADVMRNGLSTPPDILDQQFSILKSHGFTTITFDELAAAFSGKATLPTKPIILTFDDGYVDFYFNAYPLLVKYQMKGIEFIPTGLIGGGNYMT